MSQTMLDQPKTTSPQAGKDYIIKHHRIPTLGNILWHELKVCYGFVRRDLGTGSLPVPAFTLASLLYRQATTEEIARVIPCTSFSPSDRLGKIK